MSDATLQLVCNGALACLLVLMMAFALACFIAAVVTLFRKGAAK